MVLVSGKSGFSFRFQFSPRRRGWGIFASFEKILLGEEKLDKQRTLKKGRIKRDKLNGDNLRLSANICGFMGNTGRKKKMARGPKWGEMAQKWREIKGFGVTSLFFHRFWALFLSISGCGPFSSFRPIFCFHFRLSARFPFYAKSAR